MLEKNKEKLLKNYSFRPNFLRPAPIIAIVLFLGLAACGVAPPIATHVNYSCEAGTQNVSSYRVEFEDTPEFLKPMLRDEASIVLDRKGLEYVEGDADAILMMAFVNRTLEAGDAAHDEAWETIAPGGGVRFVAEVNMELTNTVTREKLWAGTMSRVHNVYEGSYMHDAPARAAMREAFTNIFADYRSSLNEDCE